MSPLQGVGIKGCYTLSPVWVYLGGTTLETVSGFQCVGTGWLKTLSHRTQVTGITWPNYFEADKAKNRGQSPITTASFG